MALTKESGEASTRGHQAGGASGANADSEGHEASGDGAGEAPAAVKVAAEVVGRARVTMERMRMWLLGLLRPRRPPPPPILGPSTVQPCSSQPSGVVGLERRGEAGGVRKRLRSRPALVAAAAQVAAPQGAAQVVAAGMQRA